MINAILIVFTQIFGMKSEIGYQKLTRQEISRLWQAGEQQQQSDIWADGVCAENLGTIELVETKAASLRARGDRDSLGPK